MKVKYTTPYRWWHPSNILLPLKYIFNISDEDYYGKLNWDTGEIEGVVSRFEEMPIGRWLKRKSYGSHSKMHVHIDRWDVWNMDTTLARIVHPMLLKLKEQKHGSPMVDDEDVPNELKSTNAPPKENDWDTDDFHHDRWDWVLDEIIWTFSQLQKGDNGDSMFYSGNADIFFEPNEDGKFFEMKRGPKDTFRVDEEGKKAHYKRIENGLRLFAKYYFGLWT